jgi:two-component system sensor histidine kinase BarA
MPGLYLTKDLMFSSRVSSAARTAGFDVKVVASAAALLDQVAAGHVDVVLVDLQMPGLNLRELAPQLRQLNPPPGAIVAYGPHVDDDMLAAATEAGCDEVFTRGQFDSQIDQILAKYLSPL